MTAIGNRHPQPARRNSSVELLRLAAILLIVAMHGVARSVEAPGMASRLGVVAINSVANMGVTAFILISGFFGLRFRPSKLVALWAMMVVYALAALACDSGLRHEPLTAATVYAAVTPVTSVRWWFMTCYVVLFCLSPFVNAITATLPRRRLEALLAVLAFFLILSPTFLQHTITNDSWGKGLPNFLLAYLLGQYLRRYGAPSWLRRHALKVFAACVALLFGLSAAATVATGKTQLLLCRDNNLFVVLGAVALFTAMAGRTFHSRAVNRAATFAFPLYLANLPLIALLAPFYTLPGAAPFQPILWGRYAAAMVAVVALAVAFELVRRLLLDRLVERVGRRADRLWESRRVLRT